MSWNSKTVSSNLGRKTAKREADPIASRRRKEFQLFQRLRIRSLICIDDLAQSFICAQVLFKIVHIYTITIMLNVALLYFILYPCLLLLSVFPYSCDVAYRGLIIDNQLICNNNE